MRHGVKLALRSYTLLRRGFAGFFLALTMAAIAVLVLDARSQMARLSTASLDNVQWVLTQTEAEILFLRMAAMDAVYTEMPDLDEIRLRFDIFYSRQNTLQNSAAFADMRQVPKVAASLEEMRGFLNRWVGVIDGPPQDMMRQLSQLVEASGEIHAVARAMSLAGIQHYAAISETRRESISRTLANIALLTIFLVTILLIVAVALLRVAHAREREANDNRQMRERLETILSTSLDAVIVITPAGHIVDYNGAAERVFGYSFDEAIGAPMAELIIPDHFREGHKNGLTRYLQTGEKRLIGQGSVQLEAKRKDGSIFPIDISLARAQSPEGELFIGFIRDISERKRAQEQLEATRDRAIEGEKKKAQLLAVMSHEMRTPLNGILGTLELINPLDLPHGSRRYLQIIGSSGRQLLGHVNDVLDISRLDAGKMNLHKTQFDLVRLIEETLESQNAQAAQNGNKLILSPPNPLLHQAYSDPDRLRQILLNLLSNAIKFTRNGTITIEVECHDGLKDVELRVIDTGEGISEEDIGRIFGDFVTIDSTYSRKAEGTGLGLGISQRLATALGGEIGAESELGDGSLFWLRLSMDPPSERSTPISDKKASPQNTQDVTLPPLHVLVVEDNAVNRLVVRRMLENDGHSVSEAHNGVEGVEQSSQARFDLILMDISMPEMDGLTATRIIRKTDQKTPIIAATAHALPDELASFKGAGMNEVLVKPVSRASLRSVMIRVIDIPAQETDQAPPANPTGAQLFDSAHFDEMAEDCTSEQLARMVATFSSEMSAFLMRPPPADTSSRTALAKEAHRLVGSAGIFGAMHLTELLRSLQEEATKEGASGTEQLLEQISACWEATCKEIDMRAAQLRA